VALDFSIRPATAGRGKPGATWPDEWEALAAGVTCCKNRHLHNVLLKGKAVEKWQLGMACRPLWSLRDCGQAGGGAFVPAGTSDKATRKPSDQSLGYFLSPSGLDGGSPASEGSVAGFGKTGLLAANGSVTFPAFIFKNALAAYIRKSREARI